MSKLNEKIKCNLLRSFFVISYFAFPFLFFALFSSYYFYIISPVPSYILPLSSFFLHFYLTLLFLLMVHTVFFLYLLFMKFRIHPKTIELNKKWPLTLWAFDTNLLKVSLILSSLCILYHSYSLLKHFLVEFGLVHPNN